MEKKVRIWVTGKDLPKNLIFRENRNGFMRTMNFINRAHTEWSMIIVYDKASGNELKRYFNFDNCKTFPMNASEVF